jgi:phenylacetate-CoA ligase
VTPLFGGRTVDHDQSRRHEHLPGQIDELLKSVDGASSEYQVIIDHLNGKDILTLFVRTEADAM